MTNGEKPDPFHANRLAERLFAARWVLAASALVLCFIAWLEPAHWQELLAGFFLIAGSALFLPRRSVSYGLIRQRPRRAFAPEPAMLALAEALGSPAYIVDRDGILRHANREANQAFGQARLGDPIAFKFRNPELVALINRATAMQSDAAMEYREGVEFVRWYRASIRPIPEGGTAVRYFLLTFVDFSESRRVDQMRSDFIANASHELRTPLASLRGLIETIKGPAFNDREATSRFLELMLQQAERMSRLIDDLLSLSRIEMKAHLRPNDLVDLTECLSHVADALGPLARDMGVTIAFDRPETSIFVRGDRDELIQVFENLVENACKYGQAGGRAEILLSVNTGPKQTRLATVEVRDHGPGIAAEHLSRLTERFYRVDVERSREKQGTGLGLAIVKHILSRHGTRLKVRSTVGEGAVFSVQLLVDDANGDVENGLIAEQKQLDKMSQ